MRKNLFFFVLFIFLFSFSNAQTKDEMAIRDALNVQVNAWNAGDIDHYMQTYWQSDSLMFIGKNGITYGWENTLSKYKKGYPDTAAMGKLEFTIIEIKRLSVLYFHVTGKWHLARSVGDIAGHFTLLFKKVKNKWVIVSDHTS